MSVDSNANQTNIQNSLHIICSHVCFMLHFISPASLHRLLWCRQFLLHNFHTPPFSIFIQWVILCVPTSVWHRPKSCWPCCHDTGASWRPAHMRHGWTIWKRHLPSTHHIWRFCLLNSLCKCTSVQCWIQEKSDIEWACAEPRDPCRSSQRCRPSACASLMLFEELAASGNPSFVVWQQAVKQQVPP